MKTRILILLKITFFSITLLVQSIYAENPNDEIKIDSVIGKAEVAINNNKNISELFNDLIQENYFAHHFSSKQKENVRKLIPFLLQKIKYTKEESSQDFSQLVKIYPKKQTAAMNLLFITAKFPFLFYDNGKFISEINLIVSEYLQLFDNKKSLWPFQKFYIRSLIQLYDSLRPIISTIKTIHHLTAFYDKNGKFNLFRQGKILISSDKVVEKNDLFFNKKIISIYHPSLIGSNGFSMVPGFNNINTNFPSVAYLKQELNSAPLITKAIKKLGFNRNCQYYGKLTALAYLGAGAVSSLIDLLEDPNMSRYQSCISMGFLYVGRVLGNAPVAPLFDPLRDAIVKTKNVRQLYAPIEAIEQVSENSQIIALIMNIKMEMEKKVKASPTDKIEKLKQKILQARLYRRIK